MPDNGPCVSVQGVELGITSADEEDRGWSPIDRDVCYSCRAHDPLRGLASRRRDHPQISCPGLRTIDIGCVLDAIPGAPVDFPIHDHRLSGDNTPFRNSPLMNQAAGSIWVNGSFGTIKSAAPGGILICGPVIGGDSMRRFTGFQKAYCEY